VFLTEHYRRGAFVLIKQPDVELSTSLVSPGYMTERSYLYLLIARDDSATDIYLDLSEVKSLLESLKRFVEAVDRE
jgi:hypothetical protein